MDINREIDRYIENEKSALDRLDREQISRLIGVFVDALERECNIYIFGNGGSAATASHFQNDFNKGISEYTEKKFRFICLNDNVPTITAIANDIGYGEIYRQQLLGRVGEEDLVIAVSGSGNSENVINAVKYAKDQGALIIGLTGYQGGCLGTLCDIHVNAGVNSLQITEDIHMILDHLIMSILYKSLCGKEHLTDE